MLDQFKVQEAEMLALWKENPSLKFEQVVESWHEKSKAFHAFLDQNYDNVKEAYRQYLETRVA